VVKYKLGRRESLCLAYRGPGHGRPVHCLGARKVRSEFTTPRDVEVARGVGGRAMEPSQTDDSASEESECKSIVENHL
jgi:hypothetical protein